MEKQPTKTLSGPFNPCKPEERLKGKIIDEEALQVPFDEGILTASEDNNQTTEPNFPVWKTFLTYCCQSYTELTIMGGALKMQCQEIPF